MARFLMSDFLSTVTPDYAYTLAIAPHESMDTVPMKNQILKFTDDNTPVVLNIQDASKFKVVLKWQKIPLASAETIMELWTDSAKANGTKNSFRWTNPADGSTYVVNFLTTPRLRDFPVETYQDIDEVELLVRGNYVA